MSFGLTSTGFAIKPLDQILSDMEGVELTNISPSLDVQPTALIGVLNGIMAQAIFELWQLAAALYDGMDPDQAASDQLTSLSFITGTTRENATQTQVLGCTVNVNAGFSAAPGTMFASIVGNPAEQFTNKATVSNPGGSPSNETVDFEAVNTGPIQCLSGTLTVIAQPLAGWNSITNPSDGIVGSDIESDPLLRTRRQQELSAAGATTASAISGLVLKDMQPPTTTSATTGCTVLHNDTDSTDGNGLPPHSIEVIAYQPGNTSDDDQALVNLIFASKAAGINTHGTSSKVATDSQGNTETINYTRPSTTTLTVTITVVTDPKVWPGNTPGIAAVKQALADYATTTYQPGVEVYALALESQALKAQGVVDITAFTVNGGSSNIPIDVRHLATLSTGSITVTVT